MRARLQRRESRFKLSRSPAIARGLWGALGALLFSLLPSIALETEWDRDVARLDAATRALRDGFSERAIDILTRFANDRADSPLREDAHILLARAYLSANDPDGAYETLSLWRRTEADDRPGALFWMAEARRQQASSLARGQRIPSNLALSRQRLEQASALYSRILEGVETSSWRAAAALALVETHAALGRYDQALAVFRAHETAIRADSAFQNQRFPTQLFVAELQIEAGAFEEARQSLETIFREQLTPTHYWEATFLSARISLRNDAPREILRRSESLKQAAIMTGDPEALDRARFIIARAASDLGRAPRGVRELEWVAERSTSPETRRYALQSIVDIYLETQQYDLAQRFLAQFESGHPDPEARVHARLTRSEISIAIEGDEAWSRELPVFREIAGRAASSELASYARLRYAEGLAALGQHAAALTQFQRLVETESSPDLRITAQLQSSERFYQLGRFTEALSAFTTAWEWSRALQAADVDTLHFCAKRLVELHLQLDQRPAALDYVLSLHDTPALSPLIADLSLDIAFWDRDHGDLQAACSLFESLAFPESGEGGDKRACIALAQCHEGQEAWDQAIEVYQRWIRAHASDTDIEAGLAMARFMRSPKAIQELSRFTGRHPNDPRTPQFAFLVASQLYQSGQFTEAAENFESLALSPVYPASSLKLWSRFYAGVARLANEQFDRAMGHFVAVRATTKEGYPENEWASEPVVDAYFAIHDIWERRPIAPGERENAFDTQVQNMNAFLDAFPEHPYRAKAFGQLGSLYLKRWDTFGSNRQWLELAQERFELARNASVQKTDTEHTFAKASVGLGLAFEAQATLEDGTEKTRLLEAALESYKDYFYFEGALASPHWYRVAGEAAARLIEQYRVDDLEKAQRIRETLDNLFSQDPSLTRTP